MKHPTKGGLRVRSCRRIVTLLLLPLLLAGCWKGKEQRICEDILSQAVVDPDSVVIHEVTETEGPMSGKDVHRYNRREWPDGAPESVKAVQSQEADARTLFMSIDYTASGRTGKYRDKLLCQYVTIGGRTSLHAVSYRGAGYSGSSLSNFFFGKKWPDGLSITRKVQ